MKKVFLLFLILTLGGCNLSDKKNDHCISNWALCSIVPIPYTDINRKTIKIAVLDTGINTKENNMRKFIKKSYNTFDKSSKTKPINNHGTLITSLIVNSKHKNKQIGIKNDHVEIYDVQVLDENGKGNTKNTILGIEWSIKNKVDIINISYGLSKNNISLQKIIKKAKKNGILIIAASGNNLDSSTDYPAKYKEVISVSAIDKKNNIYIYAGMEKVDYLAPGVNIPALNEKGKIEYVTGTSFSTAYVTGLIALLRGNLNNNDSIKYTNTKKIIQYMGE
ncbi:S8 family serine peptidase [Kurthia sibirica]|uniref:Chromosome partitioning protein ParA n=1 Tax=Kurthia sibirica TaxID=202750 RepID=A0A2U3AEG3_9BACL|nr:S8 family serine peptidase [Kurthia sibirica]PWI22917.1 chromosome partitioning protein ParA [Kurthia sibirica]GEK35666.1 hypothetical protein KSI01_31990 [Kurthia sibirica]